MCVPIPPSAGSKRAAAFEPPPDPSGDPSIQSKPPGTTAVNTQPTAAPFDYTPYLGMSPNDIRTRAFASGLPQGWDWNAYGDAQTANGYMRTPNPTNHDNTGNVISPENAALWNQVGGVNGPTTLATKPASVSAPPLIPKTAAVTTPAAPPAPVVTPASAPAPAPVATTPAPAATTAAPAATPTSANPAAVFQTSTNYTPGFSALEQSPRQRVTTAISKRFNPTGWF